nr:Chain B, p6-Gag [synthetic construct]
ELYPLASLRSL